MHLQTSTASGSGDDGGGDSGSGGGGGGGEDQVLVVAVVLTSWLQCSFLPFSTIITVLFSLFNSVAV